LRADARRVPRRGRPRADPGRPRPHGGRVDVHPARAPHGALLEGGHEHRRPQDPPRLRSRRGTTMRMPAATKAGGNAAGGPDVCKTPPAPPVPTPYPNMGQVSSSDSTVSKVVICNKETVVESSKIPNSKGDEAGTLKGMVSQTNMSAIQFKKY